MHFRMHGLAETAVHFHLHDMRHGGPQPGSLKVYGPTYLLSFKVYGPALMQDTMAIIYSNRRQRGSEMQQSAR